MSQPAEKGLPVHWIGDAPTSLHGNGAASFERTTRDERAVTCRLCLSLLGRNEHGVAMCACKRYGPVHVWEPGESCWPTRVLPPGADQ